MDQPEMAAEFTALAAFNRHSSHPDRIPGIALPHLNLRALVNTVSGKVIPDDV